MKSAKSYIDRDELIEFLRDSLMPPDAESLGKRASEYERGYAAAVLDTLEEVESLL